jgi:MoxR-like ATPase
MAPVQKLRDTIGTAYLGNRQAVDRLVTCLLARGHALIEDVPGVGKTTLASALARSLQCSFGRVQCTPDLLPSDVTGASVFLRDRGQFEFRPGPVFANIVLADEINRATPRTQSALLEAMGEGSVTVEGITHRLPQPFMVVATQNPYEFEGTYTLPENQLDRFLMRVTLGYPSPDDESRVILQQPGRTALPTIEPVMDAAGVLAMQDAVDRIRLAQPLVDYIIALASATREHEELQLGVSPRGALALAQVARATAYMDDRDFVTPEDIVGNTAAVFVHRIMPRGSMEFGDAQAARRIVQHVLETVPSPA